MANDGERRMVFDLQGRRKHVVKVVYAVLALLMGGSLFLFMGPGLGLGELLGGGSSTDTSQVFTEQVTNIERKLKKDPTDEDLLLALTRSRINAGNSLVEVDPTGQQRVVPAQARVEYKKANEAWERYLTQASDEPNPSLAQLMSAALFSMAETATSATEASTNVHDAAKAQRIVAEARPTLNSLSTLAYYDYFAFDFAGGDKAADQAKSKTTSKAQVKELEKQLTEIRKRAKQFQKQVKAAEKAARSQTKEKLENPFGGLGSGTSIAP